MQAEMSKSLLIETLGQFVRLVFLNLDYHIAEGIQLKDSLVQGNFIEGDRMD